MTIETVAQIHDLNSSYPESGSNVQDGDDHIRNMKTALRADWPPQGHIYGLEMSNDTDTDHDISVAVGECADSGHDYLMKLSSAMVKQIDAAWAAGTNQGGLFSGAVANSTWYHVFIIQKDSDGSIDAGFDTSVTAANIPAGYTAYRRIGSVLTDGSANIVPFNQKDNYFQWYTRKNEYSSGSPGTSRVTLTVTTPPDVETMADMNLIFYSTSAGNIMIGSPYEQDVGVSSTNSDMYTDSSTPGGEIRPSVRTNTSSQIVFKSSVGTVGHLYINTVGYCDFRGR